LQTREKSWYKAPAFGQFGCVGCACFGLEDPGLFTIVQRSIHMEDWRNYYNEERRMGRSAKSCRERCSITMAQPARQREKAGKLYPPAIQRLVSLHSTRVPTHRWMKSWGSTPERVLRLNIFGLDCIENLAHCDILFSLRKYAAELLVEILVVVTAGEEEVLREKLSIWNDLPLTIPRRRYAAGLSVGCRSLRELNARRQRPTALPHNRRCWTIAR
jgi:hypothetical protein